METSVPRTRKQLYGVCKCALAITAISGSGGVLKGMQKAKTQIPFNKVKIMLNVNESILKHPYIEEKLDLFNTLDSALTSLQGAVIGGMVGGIHGMVLGTITAPFIALQAEVKTIKHIEGYLDEKLQDKLLLEMVDIMHHKIEEIESINLPSAHIFKKISRCFKKLLLVKHLDGQNLEYLNDALNQYIQTKEKESVLQQIKKIYRGLQMLRKAGYFLNY
ncbi:MAG: hypothetical protein ACJAXL_001025, partial [Alphaproteobacteria bacterium]